MFQRTYVCMFFQLSVLGSLGKYPEVELISPSLFHYRTFVLKSILSNISIATTAFLFVFMFMKYPFLSLYFQSVCVFGLGVSLL